MAQVWDMLEEAVIADDGAGTARALDAGARVENLVTYRRPGGRDSANDEAWVAAAATGATRALRVMLDRGAITPDTRDTDLQTALHWAVLCGQTEAVALLLLYGADANPVSSTNYTPAAVVAIRFSRGVRDIPADRDEAVRSLLKAAGAR